MKQLIGSTLILGLLSSSIAAAADIQANSMIKAVTVYPNGAKITREVTLSIPAGDSDVVIANLPINFNESSLRVSGEAQNAVSLGSVELLRNIQQDVVQQREKELRQKLEEQEEGRRVIQDALQRSRDQIKYIQKMVLGSSSHKKQAPKPEEDASGSYTRLPLEQWEQAWNTLDAATATAQDRMRVAEKSLKTYNKQIRKLNRELQLVATNQSETRTAKLHVSSDTATELSLSLTYQIRGARWSPVYDADLDTQTGNITLKSLAQISQRTGEDWTNVAVTLSTLRPSAGTQLPLLNPWVLDFMPDLPPPVVMQSRKLERKMYKSADKAAAGMVMAEAVVADEVAAAPPVAMGAQQSEVISTDFSAEYKVSGNISLDSGSNQRRFALSTDKLQAEIHLASAPRFDPRAMILAKTSYSGETPLLAGSLALYRNGSFVGNTHLSQKQSGEEIKLSFGEDDKVKIKFLPDPDKKRKDGLLFGKKKVVERHYQLSVTNHHSKPFAISLYDTFPIAANEKIKVEKTGDAPTKLNLDDKKGLASWERMLEPAKTEKIRYGYTVSYPEEKIVPGL